METNDLTIEILKSIREEIRGTNARLDGHATRLDGHTTRLDGLDARLDRLYQRQVESEIRLATELVSVVDAIHEVRDELRNDRALRARVEDHEARLERLETRAG
jgi:chromosome segregation ATPase